MDEIVLYFGNLIASMVFGNEIDNIEIVLKKFANKKELQSEFENFYLNKRWKELFEDQGLSSGFDFFAVNEVLRKTIVRESYANYLNLDSESRARTELNYLTEIYEVANIKDPIQKHKLIGYLEAVNLMIRRFWWETLGSECRVAAGIVMEMSEEKIEINKKELNRRIDELGRRIAELEKENENTSVSSLATINVGLMLREFAAEHNSEEKKNYINLCKIEAIDENILAELSPIDCGDDEKFSVADILKKLQEKNQHLYIVGEGGMGKTTSVMQLPGFVDGICYIYRLFLLKHSESLNGKTLITDFLFKEFLCKNRNMTPDMLTKFLKGDISENPEGLQLFLLLDGLNEVSDIPAYTELLKAIFVITTSESLKNLRFVITSRKRMVSDKLYGFQEYQLQKLSNSTVMEYLEQKKPEAHKLIQSGASAAANLLELLRIPMMLTLFCQQGIPGMAEASTYKNKKLPQNRGDILHNYFLRELIKPENWDADRQLFIFMFDFLFPIIAEYMCDNGLFELEDNDSDEVLVSLYCEAKLELDKYGKSGYSCTYLDRNMDNNRVYIEYFHDFDFDAVRKFLHNAGLSTGTGDRYRFSHQYFRDFLAAKYYYMQMKYVCSFISSKKQVDPKTDMNHIFADHSKTQKISDDILRFIGEICGEKSRLPDLSKNVRIARRYNTLIEKCLDIMRGDFSDEAAITVNTLISISILARDGNLAGMDFSCLNLSNTYLNGKYFDDNSMITNYLNIEKRCSISAVGRNSLGVDFSGSLLSDDNLMPRGHGTSVDQFLIVTGDKGYDCVYTFGGDTVILHNFSDGTIRKFQYGPGRILNACLLNDKVVTSDIYGNIALWKRNAKNDLKMLAQFDIGKKYSYMPEAFGMIQYGNDLIFSNEKSIYRIKISQSGKTFLRSAYKLKWSAAFERDLTSIYEKVSDTLTCLKREKKLCIILHELDEHSFRMAYGNSIFVYDASNGDPTKLELSGVFSQSENDGSRELIINNFEYFKKEKCYIISASGKTGHYLLSYFCDQEKAEFRIIESHLFVESGNKQDNRFHFISMPNGNVFLVTAYDGRFYEYSLDEQCCKPLKSYKGHSEEIKRVIKADYIHYGNKDEKTAIVSIGNDRSMRLWSASNPWEIDEFIGQYSGFRIFKKCPIPEKKLFVAALYNEKISVWEDCGDLGLQCICSLSGHTDWVWSVDAFYNEKDNLLYAVTGGQDQQIKMWDLFKGCEIALEGITQHTGKVESVMFSSNGCQILSAGHDKKVLLHTIKPENSETWKCETDVVSDQEHNGHKGKIKCAVFCKLKYEISDKETYVIFSSGEDGIVQERLLDQANLNPLLQTYQYDQSEHHGWARNVFLNKKEDMFLVAGFYENVENQRQYGATLWKRKEATTAYLSEAEPIAKPIAYLSGSKANVSYAIFSPDEKYALTTSDDTCVYVYDMSDLSTNEYEQKFYPIGHFVHSDKVFHIEFSEDNDTFYVSGLDGKLYYWDFAKSIEEFSENRIINNEIDKVPVLKCTDNYSRNMSGFLFHGSKFDNLHAKSLISDETKQLLKTLKIEVT